MSETIEVTEEALGIGIALRGSQTIPIRGFPEIARHANPGFIRYAKIELGVGVTLLGGHAIPIYRLLGIPRHAFTKKVHFGEFELGLSETLISVSTPE